MLKALGMHCMSQEEVEVLCSWNGETGEEANIENHSGYEFLVANRAPYHFASNMNDLAEKANGDLLLLINDDVFLMPTASMQPSTAFTIIPTLDW